MDRSELRQRAITAERRLLNALAEIGHCGAEIDRLRAALEQAGKMKSIKGARRVVDEALVPTTFTEIDQ
jgi:hypothetical protein